MHLDPAKVPPGCRFRITGAAIHNWGSQVKPIFAIAIAAVVAGCMQTAAGPTQEVEPDIPLTPGVPPKPAVVAKLKAAAAKDFKDPRSAQWQDMQQGVRPNLRGEPTQTLCGRVNAKNIGFRRFVYLIDADHLMIEGEGGVEASVDVIKKLCKGLLT